MSRRLVIALFALAACGEKRDATPARTEPPETGRDGGDVPTGDAAAASTDDDPALAGVPGGIPAWQAVIDRDRYLARRGQGAVIVGRLGGEAIAPGARGAIRWLLDETEGNGSLGVRIAITGPLPTDGARLAVRGAWALDGQRRWYWQADNILELTTPGPPAPVDPPSPPGHQLGAGPVPSGYRAVSHGKDGGVIVFGVIRSPSSEGDGWVIGDDSFGAPVATLTLPGERPSYGGHDLRHDDERWHLKRAVTYWVRVDRIRKRSPDALATIRAVTAPMKLQ